MTDAVLNRPKDGSWDFSIDENGDIRQQDFFDTAILVAIHEERRASSSEVSVAELRRGWIGNESTPGFERGSKIWLYSQTRLTRTRINDIINAARDSFTTFIDRGFILDAFFDVLLKNGVVSLLVKLKRSENEIDSRFFPLWDNSGITSTED